MRSFLLLASFLLAVLFEVTPGVLSDCIPHSHEEEVVAMLNSRSYQKEAIPPTENGTALDVEVGFQIIDYDLTPEGLLTTQHWMTLQWEDKRLAWEKNRFHGIELVHLNIANLWKPDIMLYNKYATRIENIEDSFYPPALVYSSGRVLSISRSVYTARCHMGTDDDGVSTADCRHKVGSWTRDANVMQLTLGEVKNELVFDGKREWSAPELSSGLDTKYYDCCTEPYISVSLNMTFHKI